MTVAIIIMIFIPGLKGNTHDIIIIVAIIIA